MSRVFGAGAIFAALATTAVTLSGCASGSGMQDLWTDPAYKAQPVHDVLVIAVRKDARVRQLWEDSFAHELQSRGIHATPSYTLFDQVPDTTQVTQAIQAHHFGTVLISERLASDTEATIVPGNAHKVTTRYFPPGSSLHGDRKELVETEVVDPDKMEKITTQRIRTDVWAGEAADRLVWSGTIAVDKPLDGRFIPECVSRRIVPGIARAGLLP